MGIGGDQSGSIRVVCGKALWCHTPETWTDSRLQPASHSGIVGLRPTYGLVPTTGVISIEAEKDIIGTTCSCGRL